MTATTCLAIIAIIFNLAALAFIVSSLISDWQRHKKFMEEHRQWMKDNHFDCECH